MFIDNSFLVPVVRDSNRAPHNATSWTELEAKLVAEFGGFTRRGQVNGYWRDSSGKLILDTSEVYSVGFDTDNFIAVDAFAKLMAWVKSEFDQQCIYVTKCEAYLA